MTIDKIKLTLKNIIELVEDKEFPARRNITDYVLELIEFKYRKECDDYVNELYAQYDKNK